MINILISLALAALVALGMSLGLGVHPGITIPFGLICGVVAMIFLARNVQQKLEGMQAQVGKLLQEQKFDRAIEVIKSAFAFEKRQLFLGAQLHSMIGSILYQKASVANNKKELDQAEVHLKQGFFKDVTSQCMLAAIYFKRKDYEQVKKVMDAALKHNKKESLAYALYAWMLYQNKEKERAIEILQQGLVKLPSDERLLTNLSNLQNNKKMKMKVYGQVWVQFMLERPPRIMQEQQGFQRGMSRKAMFRGR